MRKALAVTGGVVALLGALACGLGTDPDGEGATIVDDTGGGAADAAEDDGDESGSDAAVGTRQNPLAPGTTFAVGDWTVEFGATDTDVDEIVLAENMFNDPPAEGRRFVMVEVTVTYTGDDSGTPWLDLGFTFYGSGGNTFGSSMDDFCGVIPASLDDHGEMFPDATATGNVCMSVPEDQIEGGAWIVEATFTLDGDRTFVALE